MRLEIISNECREIMTLRHMKVKQFLKYYSISSSNIDIEQRVIQKIKFPKSLNTEGKEENCRINET